MHMRDSTSLPKEAMSLWHTLLCEALTIKAKQAVTLRLSVPEGWCCLCLVGWAIWLQPLTFRGCAWFAAALGNTGHSNGKSNFGQCGDSSSNATGCCQTLQWQRSQLQWFAGDQHFQAWYKQHRHGLFEVVLLRDTFLGCKSTNSFPNLHWRRQLMKWSRRLAARQLMLHEEIASQQTRVIVDQCTSRPGCVRGVNIDKLLAHSWKCTKHLAGMTHALQCALLYIFSYWDQYCCLCHDNRWYATQSHSPMLLI